MKEINWKIYEEEKPEIPEKDWMFSNGYNDYLVEDEEGEFWLCNYDFGYFTVKCECHEGTQIFNVYRWTSLKDIVLQEMKLIAENEASVMVNGKEIPVEEGEHTVI